jgi:hypothetical protein
MAGDWADLMVSLTVYQRDFWQAGMLVGSMVQSLAAWMAFDVAVLTVGKLAMKKAVR